MRAKYLLTLVAGLALCSCSSIKHTAAVAPVETKVVNFTVADVDVRTERITKTTSWNYNPFCPVSIETIKTNTTAEMLREVGADVLMEPQYIVKKRGFLRGGSVTVTGFPATYSNFHKMTPEEAKVFNAANVKKTVEKKKKFLFF